MHHSNAIDPRRFLVSVVGPMLALSVVVMTQPVEAKNVPPPRPAPFSASVQTLHGDWIVFKLGDTGVVEHVVRLTVLPSASAKRRRSAIRISGDTLFGEVESKSDVFRKIPQEVDVGCGDGGPRPSGSHFCVILRGKRMHVVLDSTDEGTVFLDRVDGQFFLHRRGPVPEYLDGKWFSRTGEDGRERLTLEAKQSRLTTVESDDDDQDPEAVVVDLHWLRGVTPLLLTVAQQGAAEPNPPEVSEVRQVAQGVLMTDIDNATRTIWSRTEESPWFGTLGRPRTNQPSKVPRRDCRQQSDGNQEFAARLHRGLTSKTIVDEKTMWQALAGVRVGTYRDFKLVSKSPLRIRVWSQSGPAAGDTWLVTESGPRHAVSVCQGGR